MTLLLMTTLGCQSATPSWDLFTPVAVDCAPGEGAEQVDPEPPLDPEFAEAIRRAACADDPLNCDPDQETPPEPVVAEPVVAEPVVAEPVVDEPVVAEPVPEAVVATLPEPVGLADQPNWGVRLLKTLPTAQPPRAAIGLSDGTELVVSPGSMIPEAGIVVVSVGDGVAQVATVEAAGDHARIQTLTLHAQY